MASEGDHGCAFENLDDLIADAAGASFDKQLQVTQQIGTDAWDLDMAHHAITFKKRGLLGRKISARAEVLGTESAIKGTWLWRWASEDGRHESEGAAACVRSFGEREQIAELLEAELPLDVLDGHRVGIMATHICGSDGYYRAPYEGGAAFVLLHQAALRVRVTDPLARVSFVFPQMILGYPVRQHRRALEAYAAYYHLAMTPGDSELVIRDDGPRELVARFDELGRLEQLDFYRETSRSQLMNY